MYHWCELPAVRGKRSKHGGMRVLRTPLTQARMLTQQLPFRRCPGDAQNLASRLLTGRIDVFAVYVTPPRDKAQPIRKHARRRRPPELVCSIKQRQQRQHSTVQLRICVHAAVYRAF